MQLGTRADWRDPPLMREVKQSSLPPPAPARVGEGADATSPGTTRLSPSEIESLRRETKCASAWAKEQLAKQVR